MPRGYGPFASFRGTILTRGHILSQAERDGILWCGSRVLPTNLGVKVKKIGLWLEMLSFVLAFTRVFCPGTRLYSALGGGCAQVVFWGAQAPKCTPVAPGLHSYLPAFGRNKVFFLFFFFFYFLPKSCTLFFF